MNSFLSLSLITLLLISTIWIVIIAFEENIWWGIGSLFIPLIAIIFVITHFQRVKKPAIILLSVYAVFFMMFFSNKLLFWSEEERSALYNLKVFHALCRQYNSEYGSYPDQLAQIFNEYAADMRDVELDNIYEDYDYKYNKLSDDTFEILAVPEISKYKTFYINQMGIIRKDNRKGIVIEVDFNIKQ